MPAVYGGGERGFALVKRGSVRIYRVLPSIYIPRCLSLHVQSKTFVKINQSSHITLPK